jgi:hypothetical protein
VPGELGVSSSIRRSQFGSCLDRCSQAFAPTSDAVYGIDISLMQCESGVSQDAWNCLKNNLGDNAFGARCVLHAAADGLTCVVRLSAIIETWNGGYQFDVNIANCVAGAWAAGFA